MRKLFFPAWYLPNGVINAAENQLDEASSSCEGWGISCGLLVVVAVIAELVIAWIEPPYNTFLTESAIADAAIAVGIIGEVLFGMRNNRIQTELRDRSNKRVEEAIERAAALEKEAAAARERVADIERLTSWRHVSYEQSEQLAASFGHLAPHIDLLVEYQNGDAEAWSYSLELAHVFASAGVRRIRRVANFHLSGIAFGVRIVCTEQINGSFIVGEFGKAGIPAQLFSEYDLSTHLPRNEIAPNLYIFVGPKPPPRLEDWENMITEIAVAQSANTKAAELDRRAAQMEERTVERRLTEQQYRAIFEGMRGYRTNLRMSHIANDRESAAYAAEIKRALEAGGATVALWPASFNGHIVSGLHLVARSGDSEEADRLFCVLTEAGLSVARGQNSDSLLSLHVGHRPAPATTEPSK